MVLNDPLCSKKYSVRGHLGPAYFTSISPNGHIGPDQLQSQVSSFAAEFVFFKGGHLGPDQLWSQMSSFAKELIYCKSGHLGPYQLW